MKVQIYAVLFALSMLSVGAIGQCAKPEMNPIWDTDKPDDRLHWLDTVDARRDATPPGSLSTQPAATR